jgi:phosphatidate cytidylyltransferase
LNNFTLRAITGFFFVALIIGSIFWNQYSFSLLFLTCTILGQLEFYRLTKKGKVAPQTGYGIFAGIALYISCAAYVFEWTSFKVLLINIPVIFFVFIIELYKKSTDPFRNIAFTILGVLYVAVPFALLNFIVCPSITDNEYHPHYLLGYFFLLWANDTGAYLFGRRFGRHKLFERVSPKKSWEGSIGGLLCSFAVAFVLAQHYTELELADWIIVSAIIVVVGSLGDLVESLFKRSIDVKDSGILLPGHGGILDRFDGLLLSAPFVFVYLIVIQ